MTIHKEGYASLFITIILLVIINVSISFLTESFLILGIAFYISLFLFLIILQFFRSPKRIAKLNDNLVLAPADGKVVVIEEVEETEYFKDKRIQVSIFMSPINVHVNWAPISGIAKYIKYHAGKYLVAWHPKSSSENERTTMVIENEKHSVLIRQIAGAMARRIVYYPNENQKITQGEQVGFIKFGSRVDLFLPLDAKIKVNLEQKTKGTQTIIAELPK